MYVSMLDVALDTGYGLIILIDRLRDLRRALCLVFYVGHIHILGLLTPRFSKGQMLLLTSDAHRKSILSSSMVRLKQ